MKSRSRPIAFVVTLMLLLSAGGVSLNLLLSNGASAQTAPNVTRMGPYGGNGGDSFEDSTTYNWGTWGKIERLLWRCGSEVEGIGLWYHNGREVYHGARANDGKQYYYDLADDEHITEYAIEGTNSVVKLQFKTNKGQILGPCGGNGAAFSTTYPFDGGRVLQYLWGRAGAVVYQLGFGVDKYGGPGSLVFPKTWRTSRYGGSGGSWYDAISDDRGDLGTPITSVVLHCGASVDSFQVNYEGGGQHMRGGGGGNEMRFDLNSGESIIGVGVTWDKEIRSLQFATDQGRYSNVCGSQGPNSFTDWAPPGTVLRGFYGSAGTLVDSIGSIFGPRSRVVDHYEIISLTVDNPSTALSSENPPMFYDEQILANCDTVVAPEQSITLSYTWSDTWEKSFDWSITEGVETTISAEATAGVATSGLSDTYSLSATQGGSETNGKGEDRLVEHSVTVAVEPRKKGGGHIALWTKNVDVKWHGTKRAWFTDGSYEDSPASGTWKGVQFSRSMGLNIEQVPVTDVECPPGNKGTVGYAPPFFFPNHPCPAGGIRSGDFCCPKGCGTCGGPDCAKKPGCCTTGVTTACSTGKLPCLIATPPPKGASLCTSQSVQGGKDGKFCCPKACGTCGAADCAKKPGGAAQCCTDKVTAACATGKLPCVIAPPPPTPKVPAGGILASDKNTVCPKMCGVCGGVDCSKRPGGAEKCCIGSVTTSCSFGFLPCKLSGGMTPCPLNGVSSSDGKCCASTCGTCGGEGCSKRKGGAAQCCISNVTTSCAMGKLPCVLPVTSCPADSIKGGNACCPKSCGTCGGPDCSKRGAGCCIGQRLYGCSTGKLPCRLGQ